VKAQETGNYSFGSISTIETYGYIYNDSFDPFDPTKNLVLQDGYGCGIYKFQLITYLQANTTYVLVVTTFFPNVQGNFLVHVTGPNNVTLNHTSEYLSFFMNN
jgi:hypothetical protein